MKIIGNNTVNCTRLKLNSAGLSEILSSQKVPNHQEVVRGASEMIGIANRQMAGFYDDIEAINGNKTFLGQVRDFHDNLPGFKNAELKAWFEPHSKGYKLNVSNYAPVYGPMPKDCVRVSVPISAEELTKREGVNMWQQIRNVVIDYANQATKNISKEVKH